MVLEVLNLQLPSFKNRPAVGRSPGRVHFPVAASNHQSTPATPHKAPECPECRAPGSQ